MSLFHMASAARDRIAARLDAVHVGEPMDMGVRHPLLALDRPEVADGVEPAGRLEVQEDRLVAREALVAHHLSTSSGAPLPFALTCTCRFAGTLPSWA